QIIRQILLDCPRRLRSSLPRLRHRQITALRLRQLRIRHHRVECDGVLEPHRSEGEDDAYNVVSERCCVPSS
ncbi:BnaAnng41020D, partial [Brassica napus]